MPPTDLSHLTDAQVAALYEVGRLCPRTAERIAVEKELARRAYVAWFTPERGVVVGPWKYVWSKTDGWFVRVPSFAEPERKCNQPGRNPVVVGHPVVTVRSHKR